MGEILQIMKSAYCFLLIVTVATIMLFVGLSVCNWVYDRFIYVPSPGPVLPESVGPDAGSAICLLIASLSGFVGGGLIRLLNYSGSQKGPLGGADR